MSTNFVQQLASKWSYGRILSLLILVGTLASALGGVLGFFHLNGAEWFLHAAVLIGTLTERAQGGAGALAASIINGHTTQVEVDGQVARVDATPVTTPLSGQQFR